jgi:hypothetical protein
MVSFSRNWFSAVVVCTFGRRRRACIWTDTCRLYLLCCQLLLTRIEAAWSAEIAQVSSLVDEERLAIIELGAIHPPAMAWHVEDAAKMVLLLRLSFVCMDIMVHQVLC